MAADSLAHGALKNSVLVGVLNTNTCTRQRENTENPKSPLAFTHHFTRMKVTKSWVVGPWQLNSKLVQPHPATSLGNRFRGSLSATSKEPIRLCKQCE